MASPGVLLQNDVYGLLKNFIHLSIYLLSKLFRVLFKMRLILVYVTLNNKTSSILVSQPVGEGFLLNG